MLRTALEHHQAGKLDDAETAYQAALERAPDHPEILQLLGALQYQKGNLEQAEKLLQSAISFDPDLAQAHCNLGNVFNDQGRKEEALAAYHRALKADPEMVQAHTNIGNIHYANGSFELALQAYQQALTINPQFVDALYQSGNIYRAQHLLEQALEQYNKALSVAPDFVEGHVAKANVFLDANQPADAIPAFYHALTLRPELFEAHFGMGEALFQQHRTQDSIRAYRKALALKPNSVDTLNNLGNVHNERGEYDQAQHYFDKALTLNPNDANSWNNLGNNLQYQGKPTAALDAFKKAVELDPNRADALNNIGQSLIHLSQPGAAIEPLRRALTLSPDDASITYNLAYALNLLGERQESYSIFRRLLRHHPNLHLAHDTLLMCLSYDPDLSPEQLYNEHVEWGKQHGSPRRHLIKPLTNSPDSDRKLRIGYVSTDLGRHSVAYMTRSTITRHDPASFETFFYSGRTPEDEITEQFRQSATQWRSTLGLSESELANLIRSDQIDILIDLNGHTAGSRLTVFAQKPAPIQVTWIGYCDTTGLDTIDYILMDPVTASPDMDHLFSEQVIRLPDTRFCYSPPEYAPPVSRLPALTKGYITFGSFSNLQKINDHVIDTWSQILRQVPASKLIINWKTLKESKTREKLIKQFAQHGITANRLDLRQGAPTAAGVLEEYSEVDIALDSFPYSGGITTCEALWMGVPVVTILGSRAVSRQSASIINAAGYPETIASNPSEYIQIATELAADIGKLYATRKALRTKMQASPICDAPRFLEHLEASYKHMWKTWATRQS